LRAGQGGWSIGIFHWLTDLDLSGVSNNTYVFRKQTSFKADICAHEACLRSIKLYTPPCL